MLLRPLRRRNAIQVTQDRAEVSDCLNAFECTIALLLPRASMHDEDPEHGYSRSLFWQASRLTDEKACLPHDDRLDALAIACAFFVESAAQDQDKARQSRADQLFEEELEAWMDETVGSIDGLAMGWRPKRALGKAHGGVKRLRVGA